MPWAIVRCSAAAAARGAGFGVDATCVNAARARLRTEMSAARSAAYVRRAPAPPTPSTRRSRDSEPRRASRRRPAGLDLHAAGDHGRARRRRGRQRPVVADRERTRRLHAHRERRHRIVSVRDRRHQRAVGREPGGQLRGRRPGSLDRRHAGRRLRHRRARVRHHAASLRGAPQHGHPRGGHARRRADAGMHLGGHGTGVQAWTYIWITPTDVVSKGELWTWVPYRHEVCTSSHPHPDAPAELARSYAEAGSTVVHTFCYNGAGAALNDTQRERAGHLHQLLRRRRLPALHRQRRLRSPRCQAAGDPQPAGARHRRHP